MITPFPRLLTLGCALILLTSACLAHGQERQTARLSAGNTPVDSVNFLLPEVRLQALKDVESLYQTQGFNAALERVNQLIAEHPQRSEPVLFRGQLQLAGGNQAAAVADFQRALQLNPHEGFAISRLAQIEANAGNISAALHRIHQGLQQIPGHPDLYITQAEFEIAQGQLDKAIATLTLATRFSPPEASLTRIYNRLTDLYLHQRKFSQAEEAASRAPAIESTPELLLKRGDARAYQSKFAQALDDYLDVANTPYGQQPNVQAAIQSRLTQTMEAAYPVLPQASAHASRYMVLMPTEIADAIADILARRDRGELTPTQANEELANYAPFSNCSDGAYVFLPNPHALIGTDAIGHEQFSVPVRQVGAAGKFGDAVYTESESFSLEIFKPRVTRLNYVLSAPTNTGNVPNGYIRIMHCESH